MPSSRGTTAVTDDHDDVASVACDATAVDAASQLHLGTKEPKLQCMPPGRGTTTVTNNHDDVAIATGDAAVVDTAS